jgi:two-component system, LytTR family, response regulator
MRSFGCVSLGIVVLAYRTERDLIMDILIVDNDANIRTQIKEFCRHTEDVNIIGETDTAAKGLQAAETLRPELLLIAVGLPDRTGFDVLRALRRRHKRRSIMMTDDIQDAATAIAAGAIGYLVKPLTEDAFSASVLQARERLTPRSVVMRGLMRGVAPAVTHKEAEPGRPMFLVGERDHRLFPLDPDQIDFVESAGNYVKYHLAGLSYIARESIKRLDVVLVPAGFIRIERSLLLNIRAIAYVQPVGHGKFVFTLSSGVRLHSGYGYRDAILSVLPLRRRVPKQSKLLQTTRGGVVSLCPDPKGRASKVAIS